MRPWSLALLTLGWVGCSGEAEPPPPADTDLGQTGSPADTSDPCAGELGLEIGTGTETFSALDAQQDIPIVHGPQGGYHLDLAVRVCGFDPVIDAHLVVIDAATGTVVSDLTYPAPTTPDGACCGWRSELWSILDVSDIAEADGQNACDYLQGRTVQIEVDVADGSGHTAGATQQVTASFP